MRKKKNNIAVLKSTMLFEYFTRYRYHTQFLKIKKKDYILISVKQIKHSLFESMHGIWRRYNWSIFDLWPLTVPITSCLGLSVLVSHLSTFGTFHIKIALLQSQQFLFYTPLNCSLISTSKCLKGIASVSPENQAIWSTYPGAKSQCIWWHFYTPMTGELTD